MVESIRTGEPKGYESAGAMKPKSEAEVKCEKLTAELLTLTDENAALKKRVAELELKLQQYEGAAKPRQTLADAIMTDSIVNGTVPADEDA